MASRAFALTCPSGFVEIQHDDSHILYDAVTGVPYNGQVTLTRTYNDSSARGNQQTLTITDGKLDRCVAGGNYSIRQRSLDPTTGRANSDLTIAPVWTVPSTGGPYTIPDIEGSGTVTPDTHISASQIEGGSDGQCVVKVSGVSVWGGCGGVADAVWGAVTGTLSDQTDLQSALDTKQAALGFTPLNAANNLSDLASASTARTNLGLEGAALLNVGTSTGTVAAGDDSRLSDARTPVAPSASTLGGAKSITCANQVLTALSTAGVLNCVTITSTMTDTSIAHTGVDVNTSYQVTATHLAAGLPRAQGGLNSASAGTGILRDGTTPTASELSGDATTSGSNAVTVAKVNGNTPGATCTNQFVRSIDSSARGTCAAVAAVDLPNPGASALGGVQSKASASHQFLTSISTAGVVGQAQPAFTDISGTATAAQLPTANRTGGFSVMFRGSDATAGATLYLTIPYACAITDWVITGDSTATIKLWRVADGGTALPTVSNTLSTSGFSLATGTRIHSTTLTDLNSTAIAAYDTLGINLFASASTHVEFTLGCQR
ncbi:MAG TPA: hypothetical protein VGM97_01980 [Steroidobacteraceae bacterium]